MTKNVETKNKRRFERQALSIPSALKFHEKEPELVTNTEDLGQEGARFAAEKSVQPGAPVLLRLQLGPDGQVLECKGKVCWSTEGSEDLTVFGIRFMDLREDERELLRKFLEQC